MTAQPKDDRFSSTRPFGTGHGHGYGHGHGDKDNIDPAAAENPLVGLEGALAWQYAWTSAIALAWSDAKMKKQLVDDPHHFFKVYTNYILPTGIKLTVKEMEKHDKAGEATGWDPDNKIWYLQKTELTMYIPTPPPLEQQAVALAAYSATARAYPFTGC
jgi:ribosomally synthesized peptide (two-chain TOMM family)